MSPARKKTKKKPYRPKRRTDRNAVGAMAARIRRQHGITQEDLAGRAAVIGWDISREVIKRIERGEREVTDIELRLLARALRVSPAVLLA